MRYNGLHSDAASVGPEFSVFQLFEGWIMPEEAQERTLVVPEGLSIGVEEGRFILRCQGDIVLKGSLPPEISRIESRHGSIFVHAPHEITLPNLDAIEGGVELSGTIHFTRIRARRVSFRAGNMQGHIILARRSIQLRGDTIQVDVLCAPSVRVSEHLSGRATVIESQNELGATLLKGCFRLNDYLEIFPNGQDLLDKHPEILASMDLWEDESDEHPETADSAQQASPMETGDALDDEDAEVLSLADAVRVEAPAPSEETLELQSIEMIEDLESERTIEQPMSDDFVHQQLNMVIKKVGTHYGEEEPPPLTTMRTLIDKGEYDALRKRLPEIWKALLSYHRRRADNPPNSVTRGMSELMRILDNR